MKNMTLHNIAKAIDGVLFCAEGKEHFISYASYSRASRPRQKRKAAISAPPQTAKSARSSLFMTAASYVAAKNPKKRRREDVLPRRVFILTACRYSLGLHSIARTAFADFAASTAEESSASRAKHASTCARTACAAAFICSAESVTKPPSAFHTTE